MNPELWEMEVRTMKSWMLSAMLVLLLGAGPGPNDGPASPKSAPHDPALVWVLDGGTEPENVYAVALAPHGLNETEGSLLP